MINVGRTYIWSRFLSNNNSKEDKMFYSKSQSFLCRIYFSSHCSSYYCWGKNIRMLPEADKLSGAIYVFTENELYVTSNREESAYISDIVYFEGKNV